MKDQEKLTMRILDSQLNLAVQNRARMQHLIMCHKRFGTPFRFGPFPMQRPMNHLIQNDYRRLVRTNNLLRRQQTEGSHTSACVGCGEQIYVGYLSVNFMCLSCERHATKGPFESCGDPDCASCLNQMEAAARASEYI